MNLYEIDARIMQAFESAVDEETGEIVDTEAYAAMNALEVAREDKIESILLWIKNLDADAESLKKEKMAFADRQSRAERKAESLRKYVSGFLAGEKFRTSRVAVSWKSSTSAEYTGDLEKLPDDCVRVKKELNKTALKERLLKEEKIPGARLVKKNNMQIK